MGRYVTRPKTVNGASPCCGIGVTSCPLDKSALRAKGRADADTDTRHGVGPDILVPVDVSSVRRKL